MCIRDRSNSEADGTLIGLLSSPDEDIRNRAALHLAIRASDEGAAALGTVARDPLGSDAGRIAAAQSLAGMATRAAAEALLALSLIHIFCPKASARCSGSASSQSIAPMELNVW